jgi:hypothetical protein
MVRLTIQDDAATALAAAREQVELHDEAGKRLGVFLPAALHERLLYDWAKGRFSEAELAAARAETGGCTLAEIWARLGRT